MQALWAADLRPPALKLVAARVADRVDRDTGGGFFIGLDRIAAECGISRSQAQRHMIALRKLGLIELEKPATQWSPPQYRMPLAKLEALPKATNSERRDSADAAPDSVRHSTSAAPESARGSTHARQGQHGRCSGAAPMLHKTSETSLDVSEEEKASAAGHAPDGAAGKLPGCVDPAEWSKALAARPELDWEALRAEAHRHAGLGCPAEAMTQALRSMRGSGLVRLIPSYAKTKTAAPRRAKTKHAGITETWAKELAKEEESTHGCKAA